MNRRINPKGVRKFMGNSISTNSAVNATNSISKKRRPGMGYMKHAKISIIDDKTPQRVFRDTKTGFSFDDMEKMRKHDAKIISDKKQAQYYENKTIAQNALKQQKKDEKMKRMKTIAGLGVAGAYAGTDTINRYRSGGSITRNEKGERDVVGVPLL